MTTEAALSKLSYVLGKSEWSLSKKRRAMSSDLRGEISINVPTESSIKAQRPIQDDLIMSKKVVIMAMCLAARVGDVGMLEKIGSQYNKWDVNISFILKFSY